MAEENAQTTDTEGLKRGSKPKKASARELARERGRVKKVKAPREPRPQVEKARKGPPPVVFAFRLTEAERDRIHAAAGPARASKFVVAATMAAVEGDVEAFKKVVASRATK